VALNQTTPHELLGLGERTETPFSDRTTAGSPAQLLSGKRNGFFLCLSTGRGTEELLLAKANFSFATLETWAEGIETTMTVLFFPTHQGTERGREHDKKERYARFAKGWRDGLVIRPPSSSP